MTKQTLQIDFDGTLAKFDGKWRPPDQIGEVLPNARTAMWILSKQYRLICFTARFTEHHEYVDRWLKKHGFPPMIITNKKDPNAHLTIDDRALTFTGVWDQGIINRIREFRPWWKDVQQSDPASDLCPSSDDQSPPDQTLQQPA